MDDLLRCDWGGLTGDEGADRLAGDDAADVARAWRG